MGEWLDWFQCFMSALDWLIWRNFFSGLLLESCTGISLRLVLYSQTKSNFCVLYTLPSWSTLTYMGFHLAAVPSRVSYEWSAGVGWSWFELHSRIGSFYQSSSIWIAASLYASGFYNLIASVCAVADFSVHWSVIDAFNFIRWSLVKICLSTNWNPWISLTPLWFWKDNKYWWKFDLKQIWDFTPPNLSPPSNCFIYSSKGAFSFTNLWTLWNVFIF